MGFLNQNISTPIITEVHASTMNIDANAGIHHVWTATGAETINVINGIAGNQIVLTITCDALARLITVGTGMSMPISTLLLTALKSSVITLDHNGTIFVGSAITLL